MREKAHSVGKVGDLPASFSERLPLLPELLLLIASAIGL